MGHGQELGPYAARVCLHVDTFTYDSHVSADKYSDPLNLIYLNLRVWILTTIWYFSFSFKI